MNLPVAKQAIYRLLAIAAQGAVLALACAQPAGADEFDTFNFNISDTYSNDANVFRSPSSSPPPPGFGTKSDRINVLTLGASLDKPYSLQRFQVSGTQVQTKYETFSYLNYDSTNYRGAWVWSVSPHLTGVWSYEKAQAQVPFAQVGGTQKNVRTSSTHSLSADMTGGGAWHLTGLVSSTQSETQQTILSQPSYQNNHFELGVRYVSLAGNTIALTQKNTPAVTINQPLDPVNLLDTNYTDSDTDLTVLWKPTGKSTFDLNLTHKVRTNLHFGQRNFSGMAGRVHYLWTPTGKLTVNFNAIRNLIPYAAFGNTLQNSTYEVDRTFAIDTAWQVSGKTTVNFTLSRTLSDFRGPVFAPPGPVREDDTRIARISAFVTPRRFVTLNASLERSIRFSNSSQFQYNDTVGSVSATLTF